VDHRSPPPREEEEILIKDRAIPLLSQPLTPNVLIELWILAVRCLAKYPAELRPIFFAAFPNRLAKRSVGFSMSVSETNSITSILPADLPGETEQFALALLPQLARFATAKFLIH
jgi:hypothetical protein